MDTIDLTRETDKMIGDPTLRLRLVRTSGGRTETKQEIVSAKHI